eukprot:139115_1
MGQCSCPAEITNRNNGMASWIWWKDENGQFQICDEGDRCQVTTMYDQKYGARPSQWHVTYGCGEDYALTATGGNFDCDYEWFGPRTGLDAPKPGATCCQAPMMSGTYSDIPFLPPMSVEVTPLQFYAGCILILLTLLCLVHYTAKNVKKVVDEKWDNCDFHFAKQYESDDNI